jgi:hypothetical protein
VALPHWQQARSALYVAYPGDAAGKATQPEAGDVKVAEKAFLAAMKKSGGSVEHPSGTPLVRRLFGEVN